MTLSELVPTLEVCQQLKAAGFPQDMALVWVNAPQGWINGGGASLDLETRKVTPIPYMVSGGYANEVRPRSAVNSLQYIICAAPTAGELEEWLLQKYRGGTVSAMAIADNRYAVALFNDVPPISWGKNHDTVVAALAVIILEVAG